MSGGSATRRLVAQEDSAAHSRAILLVARDAAGVVGTVQLRPAWAPSPAPRADVASSWSIAGAPAPAWARSSSGPTRRHSSDSTWASRAASSRSTLVATFSTVGDAAAAEKPAAEKQQP